MANPFLNDTTRDIETAIMFEQAIIHDIGKAIAFTDGKRVFVNTEDNLFDLLTEYHDGTLKWILWHERYHMELRHHTRYFQFLADLEMMGTTDEFALTKDEVNIIMDILVHDSLSKMFPELIDTAVNNCFQMRDRNALKYTFKTYTLEEMLEEYAKHKKPEDPPSRTKGGTPIDDTPKGKGKPSDDPDGKSKPKPSEDDTPDGHGASGHGKDYEKPEITDKPEPKKTPEPEPKHDETDWSKLKDRDMTEFIDEAEGDRYMAQVNKLKRKKIKLGRLTETLNALATTTRTRSYKLPSTIRLDDKTIFKGKTRGKTALYLCFDASGSMGREMDTFKEIIGKSIPQALDTPTTWFSGYCYGDSVDYCKDPDGRSRDYYKGKFRDFMKVSADSGYSDDGDRTIELCWKAEQLGYSPIGITDGGGQISWSKDMLKQLKRTILVGQNNWWLEDAKRINPNIQTLDI